MKNLMKTIVSTMVGGTVGAVVTSKVMSKTVSAKDAQIDKFRNYYNILNEWLVLKLKGESLANYFEKNNMKSIAIYGMGELGNRLYEELRNSDIKVKYAIDKNATSSDAELVIVDITDDFDEVDVMVVTATFAFDEIKEELNDKVDWPIVSLEDVVCEAFGIK